MRDAQGHQPAHFRWVLDVLDRARLAGLTRVSLATQPRRENP